MDASLVVHGDGPLVFAAAENDVELVALAVEDFVVGNWSAAPWNSGNPVFVAEDYSMERLYKVAQSS